MPTHHEQAPSYYEKKVISALYIHGTGIGSEYVHMYKCVHVFIKESRIPSPIQISITASVSHPNMPNHPILSAEQPRNYRQTSKNDHH